MADMITLAFCGLKSISKLSPLEDILFWVFVVCTRLDFLTKKKKKKFGGLAGWALVVLVTFS
jgi:hypothetical protein